MLLITVSSPQWCDNIFPERLGRKYGKQKGRCSVYLNGISTRTNCCDRMIHREILVRAFLDALLACRRDLTSSYKYITISNFFLVKFVNLNNWIFTCHLECPKTRDFHTNYHRKWNFAFCWFNERNFPKRNERCFFIFLFINGQMKS